MPGKTTSEQIVETADRLFYEKGYEHTSFADIAAEVGISRGNFYHHFKTKDAILNAVIDLRLINTRAMLEQWEQDGQTPEDRIRCFIRILITNQTKIMEYGCPVGTLVSELAKLNHAALADANRLFTLFRDWLSLQFKALGREEDAEELAMHLLARSQGVATLANAFHDETFIRAEVDALSMWLHERAREAA
ncbi:MAG: TetR/AcrR family transcriptional regulator [Rhodobiaceae bacterium]|nr:TetR/AcrR family transcriptional regulator [Rhodobiaceae bacterium]MCC0011904.1 TetR/AcrR family transcriptional regulator [Rhodobiaceae bacterium]MCC0018554.1 TetR/AcrR family transcriptional regulator [Rhodobiaceae bacterium]MCC0050441.1 TetR/AcrR family transcriptional regulator [Rhodobiaceae bacterium]MCC0061180.1 TetR/AcrR family transcriptional regulator [Rhodobiaceae bacterium]